MARPCPRCSRANGPHRDSCLYCGAALPPDEQAAPAEPPPELDELFRRAMSGGDTARLAAALTAWKADSPTTTKATHEAPAAGGPEDPSPVSAGPSVDDVFERLVGLATSARWAATHDPGALPSVLDELDRAVDDARSMTPAAPTAPPPAVELPPYRQPLALVLDGPADDAMTPALAAALGVDGVTARMAALSRTPRIALRGEDAPALTVLAGRVASATGLRATVVDRSSLEAISPPLLLLRQDGDVWEAAATGGWVEGEASGDVRIVLADVALAVRGEVVVRRLRETQVQRRSGSAWMPARREAELRSAGEQRVGVIDLHGSDLFVRLVEGLTDLGGQPGHDPTSSLRSFRALSEALTWTWPGATVLEVRICQPVGDLARAARGDERQHQRDGWSAWEEHTRVCRVHAGLPATW